MLNDIDIKSTYRSAEENLADSFYNPVLQQASSYDRVSGYFSSKALISYARGIEGLINNNGKMRLIISHEISMEDFKDIKLGYSVRDEIKMDFVKQIKAIENSNDLSDLQGISNLAHLIAIGILDIKIGFKTSGLFHTKFGLISDESGNEIYFVGSNNETDAAMFHNYEVFNVTASWLSSKFDQKKIEEGRSEFENLWSDNLQDNLIYVKEVNDLIRQNILLFDTGKVVIDMEILAPNKIVISYNNDSFRFYNNLVDKSKFNKESFVFYRKLSRYFEDNEDIFVPNLTYIDMNNIIKELIKMGEKEGFEVLVAQSAKKSIDESNYMIQERFTLGNIIKRKDDLINDEFEKFSSSVDFELERKLRDEQMWAAFHLTKMKYSSNFSVPGSGKTSMVYGAFAYLSSIARSTVDKIIMVGPKNSFESWKDEFINNFGDKRDLSVLDIHEADNPAATLRSSSHKFNLILINYESLGSYQEIISEIVNKKTMLVYDEVHRVKGIGGIYSSWAIEVSRKAGYKVVLTGTPIPNSYKDIYNMLNILYGDEYKLFFGWEPHALKNASDTTKNEINKAIFPFFWRTNKLQLNVPSANPDKICQVVASQDEQDLINMLYSKYRTSPFILYIKLIQAASNPKLLLNSINELDLNIDLFENFEPGINEVSFNDNAKFTNEDIKIINKIDYGSKFKRALEIVSELVAEGKKVIVWCIFVDTIINFQHELDKMNIEAESIHGGVSERKDIIDNFKTGKTMVLITNPHTLGESVSLHHAAHDAVYLEYSFNLTHMLQSRDRIHRLGLSSNQYTQYHYLMMESILLEGNDNYIDERIYSRLEEKRLTMEKAIEGDYLVEMPQDVVDDVLDLFSKK